jgi:peptidoglycan/LPS O-acetylase OafA/YrhL
MSFAAPSHQESSLVDSNGAPSAPAVVAHGASPSRARQRNNNFGFLRLLFATLVIVAHSPGILDGNTDRELLTRAFGTVSFGIVAVDGFFLISGYLITKSFLETNSISLYFEKRGLRILPGYFVSFWLCILVLAPFVGAEVNVFSPSNILHFSLRSFRLTSPAVPGVFPGLPYANLNVPMYTIAYEFRCYIMAAAFGLLGMYQARNRSLLIGLVVLAIVANALVLFPDQRYGIYKLTGGMQGDVRFFGVFETGALYFLLKDRINLTHIGAICAAVILYFALFNRYTAEPAFTIFGGYLIFWFAFKVRMLFLSRYDNKIDLSYGIYLYAWPIQSTIALHFRTIDPWLLTIISFVIACAFAFVSWILIEKPALELVPVLARRDRLAPKLRFWYRPAAPPRREDTRPAP